MAWLFTEPVTNIHPGSERNGGAGHALGDLDGHLAGIPGMTGVLILDLAGVAGLVLLVGPDAIRPGLGGVRGGTGVMMMGPWHGGEAGIPPAQPAVCSARQEGLVSPLARRFTR